MNELKINFIMFNEDWSPLSYVAYDDFSLKLSNGDRLYTYDGYCTLDGEKIGDEFGSNVFIKGKYYHYNLATLIDDITGVDFCECTNPKHYAKY